MPVPFQTLIGTVKRSTASSQASTSALFQTLIGTVKRMGAVGPPQPVHNRFQTLIGTVKRAPLPEGSVNPRKEFQTLIGTVKRKAREGLGENGLGVSNPHRYGQKDVLFPDMPRSILVFQTLIGTVKRGSAKWWPLDQKCFKPS